MGDRGGMSNGDQISDTVSPNILFIMLLNEMRLISGTSQAGSADCVPKSPLAALSVLTLPIL